MAPVESHQRLARAPPFDGKAQSTVARSSGPIREPIRVVVADAFRVDVPDERPQVSGDLAMRQSPASLDSLSTAVVPNRHVGQ